ncbi:hypothetical protein BKA80DRAFT_272880 [Phyllosticta citrichinensis]
MKAQATCLILVSGRPIRARSKIRGNSSRSSKRRQVTISKTTPPPPPTKTKSKNRTNNRNKTPTPSTLTRTPMIRPLTTCSTMRTLTWAVKAPATARALTRHSTTTFSTFERARPRLGRRPATQGPLCLTWLVPHHYQFANISELHARSLRPMQHLLGGPSPLGRARRLEEKHGGGPRPSSRSTVAKSDSRPNMCSMKYGPVWLGGRQHLAAVGWELGGPTKRKTRRLRRRT